MSYKSEDKELTVKAVKALLPVAVSPKWRKDPTFNMAVEKGWIFPGKLVEDQLIAKSNGSLKENTNSNRTEDFDDYSDAKFISVSNKCTKMSVKSIQNKMGALRVVIFEPIQNKLYYFYFPRRAWKDYTCGPNIPFRGDGTPKRFNHWWSYEVDSFKTLAQIKKEDWPYVY